MTILAWIVVGIVAGFIAKAIVGGGPYGIIGDLVIGVVGAVVGGWVFGYFGHSGTTGINLYSIMVAAVGAIIFLAIARAVSRTARA